MAAKPFKAEAEVRSYQDACAFLGERNKAKIADNIWVVWHYESDCFWIRYGQTASMIAHFRDGTFLLGSDVRWEHHHIRALNRFGPKGLEFALSRGRVFARSLSGHVAGKNLGGFVPMTPE